MKSSQRTSLIQDSFTYDIVHMQMQPNSIPLDLTDGEEPPEIPDSTISTPKPEITVGISREAFSSRDHASLLNFWQESDLVLSDPHASQGDLLFVFLIFETKGLTTSGNLIGAQNQAAGAGTCAIRVLESLAAQAPEVNVPRIVFTVTTEGAIKELWVNYSLWKEDKQEWHYYMTCLGAWRTTFSDGAEQFVKAIAAICLYGAKEFFPQIKQVLDSIWRSRRAVLP